MSYVSQYRGQCIGRMIHHVYTYCGMHYSEQCQFGQNIITYCGRPFAGYSYDGDSDVATLEFASRKNDALSLIDEDQAKYFKRNQFFMKPYLDDYQSVSNIKMVVQGVVQNLSYTQALAIQHGRDKLQDIEQVIGMDKIKSLIEKEINGLVPVTDWKHVALCAIYDI